MDVKREVFGVRGTNGKGKVKREGDRGVSIIKVPYMHV
jgi:hypothetical protein